MKRIITFLNIFILFFYSAICMADGRPYAEIKKISVENSEIIVNHFHDWESKPARVKRSVMIITDQNPFTNKNDYSYIECFDKKTMNLKFKKPTLALTYLYITQDSKYIIGLTNIMLDNPYHFVVYDADGNLVYKMHITPREAVLTMAEYQWFKKKYPKIHSFLEEREGIFFIGDQVYVDYYRMNMPLRAGKKLWNYLYHREKKSHLSKNFSESVTNWVGWYYEPDPQIQVKYNNLNQLIAVSLIDPKQERFEIPIPTPRCEGRIKYP